MNIDYEKYRGKEFRKLEKNEYINVYVLPKWLQEKLHWINATDLPREEGLRLMGGDYPMLTVGRGWIFYSTAAKYLTTELGLENVKEVTLDDLLVVPVNNSFPDFDFCFNFEEDDVLKAQQWLHDNGCKWVHGKSLLTFVPKHDYCRLAVCSREVTYGGYFGKKFSFNEGGVTPIGKLINVTFSNGTATWVLAEDVEKENKRLKMQEEIAKMEASLASMKQQLNNI